MFSSWRVLKLVFQNQNLIAMLAVHKPIKNWKLHHDFLQIKLYWQFFQAVKLKRMSWHWIRGWKLEKNPIIPPLDTCMSFDNTWIIMLSEAGSSSPWWSLECCAAQNNGAEDPVWRFCWCRSLWNRCQPVL